MWTQQQLLWIWLWASATTADSGQWMLRASGSRGESGCSVMDGQDPNGQRTHLQGGVTLDECQDFCRVASSQYFQYHSNNYCWCFATCDFARVASKYTSKADVYEWSSQGLTSPPSLSPSAPLPSVPPSSSPSYIPTIPVPSVSPTTVPTDAPTEPLSGRWIVVGKSTKNIAPQCSSVTEQHPVRCCSDTKITGWKFNCGNFNPDDECEVWGESDVPSCYTTDYSNAADICLIAGGRLCTKAEMMKDCTRGTGCNFDSSLIWTSTPC